MPDLFLPPEGFLESNFSSSTRRRKLAGPLPREDALLLLPPLLPSPKARARWIIETFATASYCFPTSRRARCAPISTPARIKNLAPREGDRSSRLQSGPCFGRLAGAPLWRRHAEQPVPAQGFHCPLWKAPWSHGGHKESKK